MPGTTSFPGSWPVRRPKGRSATARRGSGRGSGGAAASSKRAGAREPGQRGEDQRRGREQKEAEDLAQSLSGLFLEIKARTGAEGRLFGAVTAQQISDALQKRGFEITKKHVELEHPIRIEGFHRVALRRATGRLVRRR